MLRFSRKFGPLKTVTLTAAQINALNSTPINLTDLAASLAADEFIQVIMAKLVYTPGTTPFTIGGATDFALKYSDGNGAAATGTFAATGFIDQSVTKAGLLIPISGLVVPAADIFLTLAGGNPSAGDGTLGVSLVYRDPVMRVLDDDF